MRNMLKLLTLALLLVAGSAKAQLLMWSTNLTGTSNGSVSIVSTNGWSIQQIQAISGVATPGSFTLYDMDTTNAPFFGTNYTNAAYVTRNTYPTNFVTSFIGYNGYTNFYTNAGLWTVSVTNAAATNELPHMGDFIAPANTAPMAIYDNLYILCRRGVSIRTTTNMTVVIWYRLGR